MLVPRSNGNCRSAIEVDSPATPIDAWPSRLRPTHAPLSSHDAGLPPPFPSGTVELYPHEPRARSWLDGKAGPYPPPRLSPVPVYWNRCHGPPTRRRAPLALRPRARRLRPSPPALALPPRSRHNLFLRLLLLDFSGSRPPRSQRHSSRRRIPARRNQFHRLRPFLVRAHTSVALDRPPRPYGHLLARPAGLCARHIQYLSAWHAPALFPLLPLLRQRRF